MLLLLLHQPVSRPAWSSLPTSRTAVRDRWDDARMMTLRMSRMYCRSSVFTSTGATGHSAQGAILRSRRESVGKGQHSAFLRSAYWVFAPLRRVHGSSRWPLSQLVLPLPLCLQDEGRGKVSPRAREAARAHMWSGSAGRRVRAPARHWNRRHL
jgi:hypothetical protein